MPREYHFYVYILASRSRVLYIGVTNSLARRVRQHREAKAGSFTARYHVYNLVSFETFDFIHDAIAREKQIKGWKRIKKLMLITESNPEFKDLFDDYVGATEL